MSTRATYLIASTTWYEKNICFYIHHDGYPEGAAGYFLNMYKAQNNSQGGFAEHFTRGNRNAEFTRSHKAHIDTEYRYTLNSEGVLLAEEREFIGARKKLVWKIFYCGPWYDFVNHYADLAPHERLYEFSYPDSDKAEIMTLSEANELISHEFTYSKCARVRGWESISFQASEKALHIARQIDIIEQRIAKKQFPICQDIQGIKIDRQLALGLC